MQAREPNLPQPENFGFLTMAFGAQRYIDQAVTLSLSLRAKMPGHPLAVVTDHSGMDKHFDVVVPMRKFDVAGTVHKVDMADYSPFAETMFIDSDCVVIREFEAELADLRKYPFSPIVGAYLVASDNDLWLRDVGKALEGVGRVGGRLPKFNGGVYFWQSGATAKAIFDESKRIRSRSDELGILDFDASGPGEETLIGLALAKLGVDDFYNDGGRLMRTPLNSSGPIIAEVMSGECHFIKEGRRVEPAIIHYCGPWIHHPTYEIARKELERSKRLNRAGRAEIWARFYFGKFVNKINSIGEGREVKFEDWMPYTKVQ